MKSRSIAGVAAAAAVAAAADAADSAGATEDATEEMGIVTATDCVALGSGGTLAMEVAMGAVVGCDGSTGSGDVAAGASTDADPHLDDADSGVDPDAGEIEDAVDGAVDVDDVTGGAIDEGVSVGEAGNDETDIPGGGAATTNGSSISSNGRSCNCSWKGETGTPANPFGTVDFASVSVADGAEPNSCGTWLSRAFLNAAAPLIGTP